MKSLELLRDAKVGTPFTFTTDRGATDLLLLEAVDPQSSIVVPFCPSLEIFAVDRDGVPVSILVSGGSDYQCFLTEMTVH